MEWNKIDDQQDNSQFPRNSCLVAVNEYGTVRIHIAGYCRKYEEELNAEFDEDHADYNEETDEYYIKQGWYQECPDGADYAAMYIHNSVLAWAKLPKYK